MKTTRHINRAILTGRIALAIVFFWFGFLKIIGTSPASGLVQALLEKTLPFISGEKFVIFLGTWEAAIGILFLFPKLTKLAFWLLAAQMITTFGPLFFLSDMTWQAPLLPTLEGQYIIKNLVLFALAWLIYELNEEADKQKY